MHLAKHSPKTATELAQDYPITRQGILKHLDVLEAAQLVVVQQRGRCGFVAPHVASLRWAR